MSYMKDVRMGSEGNKTLLKQYGGNSGAADRKCYASGGAVSGLNKDGPAMSEGLSAAGTPAKPSLARPGRKIAGKGKKKDAKTNINVIVASAPQEPAAPPMPMPGPGGPPMPPPGGPPMPMRASGGRVGYKIGGKVGAKKRADGGSTLSEDSKKEVARLRSSASSERGDAVKHAAYGVGTYLLNRIPGGGRISRGIGHGLTGANAAISGGSLLKGAVEDREADRIERGRAEPGKEDRKDGGKVCRAEGGPVGGLSNKDGGSGGAKGRLEKIKMYGK